MQWNVFRKEEGKKATREANCCLLQAVLVSFARTTYENQQGAVFETCCPWRWALIFGNTQIHAQIPAPCLFLETPFCDSLSVQETAQRGKRGWQERLQHTRKIAAETEGLDQYESSLPLVIGNSTWAQRSHNCPEKLLCSSGVLDMRLSQALNLKIALTYSLWWSRGMKEHRFGVMPNSEHCFEFWRLGIWRGFVQSQGFLQIGPSLKPYLILAEMKKQGRTEM